MSDESLDDIIADLDRTIAEGPASREAAEAEKRKGKEEGKADAEPGETALDPADDGSRSPATAPRPSTGGPRRRLVGLLALLLGSLGCFLALVGGFLFLRLLFGASDTVERFMGPIETGVERLEDRIDETDELIGSDSVDPDQVGELRARVDGLVDLTTGAQQSVDRIDDHPLYGILPADIGGLSAELDEFAAAASDVDDRLGSAGPGDELSGSVVSTVGDRVDEMQARVTDVRDLVDGASSSLTGWTRLGGLIGFLGSLWGLWSQIALTRRGWRGLRARPI